MPLKPAASRLYLRPVSADDEDTLHALFCMPDVYRYLADGAPPPLTATRAWMAASAKDFAAHGYGLWLLLDAGELIGCVRLSTPAAEDWVDGNTAELTYVLRPDQWGTGLATRMSESVIAHVFDAGRITRIIAGADGPNHASVAVMKRLSMTFARTATYPLGQGVEYLLRAQDASFQREPIPFA
ncbi:MAG: GNAT family N-acetyltransferase [Gammaproteobacteria bacterium]|nr:GNAT family N-acetyltransferase [Gammaproteobacteria bacterium]